MPQTLTPAARKDLKARAHALDPVVIVGGAGLTAPVLAEIELALAAHELIKVRVTGDDREARMAMRDRIVEETAAEAIQAIGKLLVFFRPTPAATTEFRFPAGSPANKKVKVKVRPHYATSKVSTRKAKVAEHPPRTDRVRKSGQKSSKKAFQNR